MELSEEAKQARREYNRERNREWREKNPEKARAAIQRWKERNPDKQKEYLRNFYERKALEMESCLDRAIAYETDNETDKEAETDIICQYCGNSFEPKRKDAIYCSGNCRLKAYRLKT